MKVSTIKPYKILCFPFKLKIGNRSGNYANFLNKWNKFKYFTFIEMHYSLDLTLHTTESL